MRVLYITSEWPTEENQSAVPFIVRQVRFLQEAGVEVDVFSFRGRKRISNYWRAYRDVQKKMHSQQYDVVHAQFGQSGLLVSYPKRTPLVVTFQGTDLQGIYTKAGRYHPVSYALRLAMQFVALRADEVILVSDHMGRYLWRRDYSVIPSGVDFDLFKPMPQSTARQALGLHAKKKYVLFVGSPKVPVKRHWLADAAVDALNRAMEVDMLVLTGVPPEKVPLYMNAADALLVTSKHEGSPNVVKEALACNLPVVTLPVGDVVERVGNVSGCAIVSSENPEIIAQGLAQVLGQARRINGWEAVQDLSEERMVQRQIEVYESVINKRLLRQASPH